MTLWRRLGHSLRLRLTLWLLAGVALFWLVSLAYVVRESSKEARELLDARLVASVEAISAVPLGRGEAAYPEPPDKRARKAGKHAGVLVLDPGGGEIVRFGSLPPGADFSRLEDGFHRLPGKPGWRVYASTRPDGARVFAAHPLDLHGELTEELVEHSVETLSVGAGALALFSWWAIGRGLRPLMALSQALRRRRPDALEPVDLPDAPQELEPVVGAVNELLARLSQAFERERRFTADVAHELRTPIAAIAAHLDAALVEGDEARRREALQAAREGTTRAAQLIEQLLTLARLGHDARRPRRTIDAAEVVRQELALLWPQAQAHGHTLEVDLPEALPALLAPEPLALIVRNLVGNALRHTPPGSTVRVSLRREGNLVRLDVEDDGPGIAPERREKLFAPFARDSAAPGTGLGLTLVREAAELLGARVEPGESRLGGARFALILPIPPEGTDR
ncbi:sensor histidine kinase [Tepidiphilus olei]|uniref:sensor histidine kinase n=1 Tax=Tepidiphilus olei TaxID=2502184 RepID=UPI00115D56E6|nr:ATP-binding protein [Tepidiphilus olei]